MRKVRNLPGSLAQVCSPGMLINWYWLHAALKVAEPQIFSPRDYNVGYGMSPIVQLFDGSYSIVDVFLGKHIPRHGEANKVRYLLLLFRRLLIPLPSKRSRFCRSDPIVLEQLEGEADRRKVV